MRLARDSFWRVALGGLLFLVLAGQLAFYGWLYSRWVHAKPAPNSSASEVFEWPAPVDIPAAAWSTVQRMDDSPTPSAGPLGRRFRLAGTFFPYADPSATDSRRCAILEDVQGGIQSLVKEGDDIQDIHVARIYTDRIILQQQGSEEELWLTFLRTTGAVEGAASASAGMQPPPIPSSGETNLFGRRVGGDRWVMSRERLLEYYQDVLDEPERIVAVYQSLKPVRQDQVITGYELDVQGEAGFFAATGLLQGDVIRKVNSMNMTSQARAEYFLKEFINNRLNAVVLDIERQGKPQKLIYLLR